MTGLLIWAGTGLLLLGMAISVAIAFVHDEYADIRDNHRARVARRRYRRQVRNDRIARLEHEQDLRDQLARQLGDPAPVIPIWEGQRLRDQRHLGGAA